MSWLLLACAIVLEVGATLALRASDGFSKRQWIGPVVVGYIGAFTLLAFSLRAGMPVGVAYGTWAALGVALTAVLAKVIFDEPLTRRMIAGIVLIGAGVLLVELGSTSAH
ncbi:DMT family transporter [Microbacterium insulae]|uniref:DMT family transporter n=1 Tax=Microbacterium insulae TaxID=483014 RepID=A0ABW3AH45_9MICO